MTLLSPRSSSVTVPASLFSISSTITHFTLFWHQHLQHPPLHLFSTTLTHHHSRNALCESLFRAPKRVRDSMVDEEGDQKAGSEVGHGPSLGGRGPNVSIHLRTYSPCSILRTGAPSTALLPSGWTMSPCGSSTTTTNVKRKGGVREGMVREEGRGPRLSTSIFHKTKVSDPTLGSKPVCL